MDDHSSEEQSFSSLEELARNRARLYERIGRIKAGLIDLVDEEACSPSPVGETQDESQPLSMEALKAEVDALRKALVASDEAYQVSESARATLLEDKIRLNHEVESIRRTRDDALEQADSLKKRLERIRLRTARLLDAQEDSRKKLEHNLREACARVEVLTHCEAEVATLQERIRNKDSEIGRLTAELEWQRADTLSMAADAAREVERLRGGVADRDAQIVSLREALALMESRTSALSDVEAQRDDTLLRLSEARERVAILEERVRHKEEELDRLRSEYDWQRDDSLSAAGEAAQEAVRMKRLLADRDDTIDQLQKQLEEAAGQGQTLDSLNARVFQLEGELRKAQELLADVKAAEVEARAQLEQSQETIAEIQADTVVQSEEASRNLQHLRESLVERDERIDTLERHVEHLKGAEITVARLNEEKREFAGRLGELERELEAHVADIESRDEELVFLREEVESLRTERDRLLAQESERSSRVGDHSEVDKASGSPDVEALLREVGSISAELGCARSEIEKRDRKLEQLQRDVEKLSLLREAGRRRVESIQTENLSLREELRATAQNLAELRGIIKRIEEAGL